jgi:glycerol-3-phosphate acyltransferase PlsY
MAVVLTWLLAVALAYLLGAIPSGLLVGRLFFGFDVREYGSRRTGATNVLRTMGRPAAAGVVVMDLAKGVLAVLLAHWLLPVEPWAHILAAFAAVAGHNWPVFVGFRGGRGVLVSAAAAMTFYPPILLAYLVVGLVIVWYTRYVSLASIIGAAVTPLIFGGLYLADVAPLPYLVFALVAATIVIVSHKDNIGRLLAGTEARLGERVPHTA